MTTFHNVFASAVATGFNASYRIAAWNTLCALIDRCLASEQVAITSLLWEGHVWDRAFDLYLTHGYLARPKSSRQLLASLTAALETAHCQRDSGLIQKSIVHDLRNALTSDSEPGRVKSAAVAIGSFLTKRVLSLDTLLQQQAKGSTVDDEYSAPVELETLLLLLFKWMGKADFGSTIAQLVSIVLDISAHIEELEPRPGVSKRRPIWICALCNANRMEAIEISGLRAHLLPALFKRSTADYLEFMEFVGLQSLVEHTIDVGSDRNFDENDRRILLVSTYTLFQVPRHPEVRPSSDMCKHSKSTALSGGEPPSPRHCTAGG